MDDVLADTLKANLKSATTQDGKLDALVLAMIAVVDCQLKTAHKVNTVMDERKREKERARNLIVPATAMFYLYGLECSYTNQSDWADYSFCAYSNRFESMALPLDVAYPNATNFNWIGFTDWTPPPTVHTNGVAFVAWQIGVDKPTNDVAMIRTGVYANALRLAPNHAITNGVPIESSARSIMEVDENE